MTEQEIRRLYAAIMAYDNRRLSEANIRAWWEQANRNRWTFDEALAAVHEHHANSTEYLMPGHVTAIIRANRRQPAPVDEQRRQLPPAPPADPTRVAEIMQQLAERLGWRDRTDQQRPALAVECPACHSAPGRPCIVRGTDYQSMRGVHPSRADLAAKAVNA